MNAGSAAWPPPAVSSAEGTLLEILRACLEDGDIGPDDNFFAMGGDSILALDVIAVARDRGLRISMRDMLTRATVRELAESAVTAPPVRELTETTVDPFDGLDREARKSLPVDVVAALPASMLQTGLIYLAEMAEGAKPYNDFVGLKVDAALDERALRSALGLTISRHRALRSSFDLHTFAEPVQLVWASAEPPLEVTIEPDAELAQDRISAWRQRILTEGIDWERAPAFRCQAVSSPRSFWLSVAVHHSIVDGWSFARLLVDLLTFYDAELSGHRPVLPPVPEHGYRDFVALERAVAASADARQFWLDEAAPAPLLFDRPRFLAAADPTANRFMPVSKDRWSRLGETANDLRVPVKSLLLAAHGWALARWTGRTEVVSGLVVNGRPEVEGADRLVGLFLNTLPVRLRVVAGAWPEMAAAALDAERRCAPYFRYPLAHIEQALRRPAFDVSFNYTNFRITGDIDRLTQVRTDDWWAYDKATTPMAVNFGVDARESGTGLAVAFDPALLSDQRVDEFIAVMDEALHAAARGR